MTPNLIAGAWEIDVTGLNPAAENIFYGREIVEVQEGELTSATVVVAPISGEGTLDITLDWAAIQTANSQVLVELHSMQNNIHSPLVEITGQGTGRLLDSAVSAGYYIMILRLLDNNQLLAGSLEVVRIIAGQTTSGTYLYDINCRCFHVQIEPLLPRSLAVSISGIQPYYVQGDDLELEASVPPDIGTVIYVWSVNGTAVFIGPCFALKDWNLDLGVQKIGVNAYTIDGLRGGSRLFDIDVREDIPPVCPLTIMDDGSGTTDPSGEVRAYENIPFSITASPDSGHYFVR